MKKFLALAAFILVSACGSKEEQAKSEFTPAHLKGTWEVKDQYMAGPFVNYAVRDEANNRYLILEGFTYAPSMQKRNLQFELEAVIQSAKFD